MNKYPSFHILVISPEKTLYSGMASSVTIPGSEGEFTVLAGHMDFVAAIKEGSILIYDQDLMIEEFSIISGVAEVKQDSCTILIKS